MRTIQKIVLFLGVVVTLLAPVAIALDTNSRSWRFVVLSDIHVNNSWKKAGANFDALVPCLKELNPRFVVLAGDSTVGNENDGASVKRALKWWDTLKTSLKPLTDAGIPILPVAGNHDYYTKNQQEAYATAWADLANQVGDLKLSGHPPQYYSLDLDDIHLSLAHIVAPNLDSDVQRWLIEDLSAASNARARLVVGHWPLASVLAFKRGHFLEKAGALFAKLKVDTYIAGHEHLVWDEQLITSQGPLRQVIVGTASGTYNYGPNRSRYKHLCKGLTCTMPDSGLQFQIKPRRSGDQYLYQQHKQTFAVVEVTDKGYDISFKAFKPSERCEIVPFGSQTEE